MASRWSELEAFSPFAPEEGREREAPAYEHEASYGSPFAPPSAAPELEDEGDAPTAAQQEWEVEELEAPHDAEDAYDAAPAEPELERWEEEHDHAPGVATEHEHVCRECGQGMEAFAALESPIAGEDEQWEVDEEYESPFFTPELESEVEPPAHVADGMRALAVEWARRVPASTAEKMLEWLERDRAETRTYAIRRFGTKYTDEALDRAWLVSRQEQMQFNHDQKVPALAGFRPPAARMALVDGAQHVSGAVVAKGKDSRITALLDRFAGMVKARAKGVSFTTYPDHGGSFAGHGLSADVWVPGGTDARGFYKPDAVVALLRVIHAVSRELGVEWRVLYNDYKVADAVNRERGRRHVVFMGAVTGRVNGRKSLIWHGPHPLINHLHLDITPGVTYAGGGAASTSGTATPPVPAPTTTTTGTAPSGATVRFAQRVLVAAEGEKLAVDGDLGPMTRAALARFRAKYELGSGGTLDERTDLALVQRALEELAQQSMFARAGTRDPATDAAIGRFRAERRLSGTGIDAALRAALADALAARSGSRAPTPAPRAASPGLDPATAARIEQYRALAVEIGPRHGIEPALIMGVIAAESAGKPQTVSGSGWRGLMQAGRDAAQHDPRTSITTGAAKLAKFRTWMTSILAKHGLTFDRLPDAEQVRVLALAYNAGQATVGRALGYAAQAGDVSRWLDAEHYRRALLVTGAYSVKAASRCLGGATGAARDALVREGEAERVARSHKGKRGWASAADPGPWAQAVAALPPVVACAIEFKHANSPRYAAKILAWRDHFRRS